MQAKYDPLYRHKMECAISATILLQSVAPRPEADILPESIHELKRNELESATECVPMLDDLIEIAARPLIRIIQCCENRTAVSAACLALARFGSTNQSCSKLLERNVTNVVATLIPSRPTIKHNMTSGEKDKLMNGDAQQMTRLPPSFFRLATSLARLPDGQNALQVGGIVKRAVERMTMGDNSPHDIAVKTEVSLLLGRMANKYSIEFGSTTEIILTPKFRIIATLLQMLNSQFTRRTRFSAAKALHSICEDVMRGVPAFIANDGVPAILAIVREENVVHPLLREALETIKLITEYPSGKYCHILLENRAQAALQHIASDLTLEEPYADTIDRYGLGDIARDCLIALDEFGEDKVGESKNDPGGTFTQIPESYDQIEGLNIKPHEQKRTDYTSRAQPAAVNEKMAFDGSYMTVGVSQYGGLVPNSDYSSAQKGHTTPIGLMSAREKEFRGELRRRKKYYDLDREGEDSQKIVSNTIDPNEIVEDVSCVQASETSEEKPTHLPVISMDEHPDIDRTVASLQHNPHLARTRPPRRDKCMETDNAINVEEVEVAPVPLVKQKKNQTVKPILMSALKDNLMLDPCFGGADVSEPINGAPIEKEQFLVKQVNPYSFGAEQFKHSSTVFGHRVDITTHRVVTGRVSESGAHAETASFKNVEESVSSMMASRAKARLRASRRGY